MCEIASGDYSWAQLRERHHFHNVSRFAKRYALEIEDIRKSMVDGVIQECAGLWISKQAMRIAEYQEIVEAINRKLHELETSGAKWWPVQALKVKLETLRMVAEELGQIPERQRTPEERQQLEYAVKGIATAELEGRLK
jgi:hypothetical protein